MPLLLAHLSDPHLGPLPPLQRGDLSAKRLAGLINWGRRRALHDMNVLSRILADLRAQAPEHIAVTGDLLNLGLTDEFRLAEGWLRSLGDPANVSFTPGNHDAYSPDAAQRIGAVFAPWMRGDTGDSAFPYLRERAGVALIGVSSAITTAPLLASGAIGATQLRFLARMLDLTRARGLARVAMIHHPPWRGGATPGRGLRDARAFEKLIAEHGADLVIHGHNHRTVVTHLPGPAGSKVPVVGVRSASAVPGSPRHLAGYHLFRFEKIGADWRIEARARGIAEREGPVIELEKLDV